MKSAVAHCKGLTYVFASVVSLITGWVPVVYAADEGGIEEIIVTARYREEELQDTPIAITAITAEDIEAKSFSASYELGYSVPNASFRPAQAAFGNTMTAFIRGVGQNDFDFAFEPGVGVYVDDVYQPFTMGTQMDLMDLDRVEVLRGPQGTLFGRGSIGGAIRLVSKKPMGDNTGFITATTGEYDRVDVRAGYDFSIIEDTLMARVTGVSKQRDGYQRVLDFACANPTLAGTLPKRDLNRGTDCKTGTQGGEDVTGARGQLRWVINENVETNFAVDYQNDASEAKADTLLAVSYQNPPFDGYSNWSANYLSHVRNRFVGGEDYGYSIPYDTRFIPNSIYETYATYDDPDSGLTFKPQSHLEKTSVSGKLDWNLTDNLALTAIGSWNDVTSNFATDADASPFNEQTVNGHEEMDWWTAEIRFSGRTWDRMDWTVGGFFYNGDSTNQQVVSIPPIGWGVFTGPIGLPPSVAATLIIDPTIPVLGNILVNAENVHKSKDQSGFGHMVFDLTEDWKLTGGVRYSHDTKDVDFDNTIVQSTIAIDDNHFDWRVGLDYKITDDILGYGSVSTGFRPPAYNPRPFTPAQAVQVGGEELTAFELGVKADLFDRRVRVNAAGFYSDYEQRIVPIGGTECLPGTGVPAGTPGALPDSNGIFCFAPTSLVSYQNAPAKIHGAELEVEWRPVDPLTINGVFGWTNWSSNEIDNCDFNDDGLPDANVTCVSDTPSYVPETNWSVSASYDFAMANGSTLTPRVDVYGQSDICFSVIGPLSCADSYELVNLRAEWTSPEGAWTAALGVSNVTDKKYFLNTFDLSIFGQPTVEGQPGHPSEWYITLGRKF
ncbi:MAG: TonB-dependent receptor [Gammaproteobacteria bacterium]|nr:TonB-dependent receptor [Gammaproteobacteria bacterium]